MNRDAETGNALRLSVGQATDAGGRDRNEDYIGIVTPADDLALLKGALFALADGVSGCSDGRQAAEAAVRGLAADYYATPETWGVPYALDKVLGAINRWLYAQHSGSETGGLATTLSALILRGQRFFFAHVGDTRIYRLRGETFEQLSHDHVWQTPGMSHVLKRAIGLDAHVAIDYGEGELAVNDVFVLASDGVWETLGDKRMHELVHLHSDPQRASAAVIAAARDKACSDNASVIVVRVDAIASENLSDLFATGRLLPLPPRLKPGAQIDGFEVIELLHESRASLLYIVREAASEQRMVLKTLQPALASDAQSCAGLLVEEWLAKRVISHYFAQVIPLAPQRRSQLYYVMSFHAGTTLDKLLVAGFHFSVAEVSQIGIRLLKGLGALHRLDILHRDIKPGNIHRGEDGKLRILDLGVAKSSNLPELASGAPGTPSYMAPELFNGGAADLLTDLYAVGVTLYELLTRRYPYGEIEPFQHPRFGQATPPTRYRPDVPEWLERVLLKAIAVERKERFETAEEFLLALEQGEHKPISPPRRQPLARRDPMLLWQAIALASLVANLLLAYLLLVG